MKKIVFFSALVLLIVIVYPLLVSSGYIFRLDYAPLFQYNYWFGFTGIADIISWIRPFFVRHDILFLLDRILIIGTFVLLMTGGYMLLRPAKSVYALLFGIFLLMVNPFLYARIMDGQPNVYLSSALLVWFVYFLQQVFEKRHIRDLVLMCCVGVFLIVTGVHTAYFMLVSYLIFFFVHLIGDHEKKYLFKQFAFFCILGCVGVGMFMWLFPNAKNFLTSHVQSYNTYMVEAFSVKPGLYNEPVNLALLRGYWGETQGRFVTLDRFYKYPGAGIILMAVIWLCVVFGIVHLWKQKKQRMMLMSMILLGVIGYLLAMGPVYPWIFQRGIQILYEKLPFYQGFRESQKWLMLLVIAYAYVGSYGVKELFLRMETFHLRKYIMMFLILMPLISTPVMLFGFIGQLQPKDFPREYYDVKEFFQQVTPSTEVCENAQKGIGGCYTVLYFPWYQYIGLGWIGTTTLVYGPISFLNPHLPSLSGDNSIIGAEWSTSGRTESKTIERFIRRRGQRANALEILQEMHAFHDEIRKMGVEYIVVFRDNEYTRDYIPFLDASEKQGLVVIEKENTHLKVYRVNKL